MKRPLLLILFLALLPLPSCQIPKALRPVVKVGGRVLTTVALRAAAAALAKRNPGVARDMLTSLTFQHPDALAGYGKNPTGVRWEWSWTGFADLAYETDAPSQIMSAETAQLKATLEDDLAATLEFAATTEEQAAYLQAVQQGLLEGIGRK